MATEKRLVDAHEVEELFYKQVEYGATDLMDAFDDALQDAKTVDAVEVVRCKDCKYGDNCCDKQGLCTYCQISIHSYPIRKQQDDYCSYGERRTDV